jgi:Resolvase, N terminal domain/Homeodomain-like domain
MALICAVAKEPMVVPMMSSVLFQALERKDVAVRILTLAMDIQTPTGKLMLTVLGGIAQFEREMMLERQREGFAKPKSAGKYKGREPIALERRKHFLRLAAEGVTKTSIARQLGIGEAIVYRILALVQSDASRHGKRLTGLSVPMFPKTPSTIYAALVAIFRRRCRVTATVLSAIDGDGISKTEQFDAAA